MGGRPDVSEIRPVTDEPVRGLVPPPWINSLSGIERMRLMSRHYLAVTPTARLFGLGLGHVSAGSATATMKASGHMAFIPALNVIPLFMESLHGAVLTALDAGTDVDPVTASVQYFRNPRPQPGSFIARARVVNSSTAFVSAAVDVEDPVGRLVGTAISQWSIKKVTSSLPPPPSIEPIEEPTYATPDPPDRPPVGATPPLEMSQRFTGLELAKMHLAGELPPLPVMHTLGLRWDSADEGAISMTMPASEWFCTWDHDVAPTVINSFASVAGSAAAATLFEPGQSVAILESSTRFLGSAKADGRLLTASTKVTHRSGPLVLIEVQVIDAEERTLAIQTDVNSLLEVGQRGMGERERVLATLLFTDIVGSTKHAERVGDARWRSLLAEHDALVRQELGAYRGREVKATGDGFLARFDSPAAAIKCARAIRNGVRRLNLEIRAGIHTGECEVHGTDLAGIALHVAARIMSLAGNSEILVSQMVRDLAAGSGVRFGGAECHTLKGVEGDWNLFQVED
jgi:class 3 adenylate cyclase